jgi:hypothetical protein
MIVLSSRFRFVLALAASAIAHLLMFVLLPNPISFNKTATESKRISVVRVISLPQTSKYLDPEIGQINQIEQYSATTLTKNTLDDSESPEKLAPSLKRLVSVSPLPNKRSLSTLDTEVPLPKIAMNQPELPEKSQENPQENPQKINRQPKVPLQKMESNPEKIIVAESKRQNNQIAKKNPIAIPIKNKPEPTESSPTAAFTTTISRIYQDYGADNLVPRQIAPVEALINPDKREPGIEWIPPNTDSKQIGTVTILLIVAPDGKVEKELINDNDPVELREIAQQTVKGYYEKFQPIEPKWKGKYRLVTIKFEFMNFAG